LKDNHTTNITLKTVRTFAFYNIKYRHIPHWET